MKRVDTVNFRIIDGISSQSISGLSKTASFAELYQGGRVRLVVEAITKEAALSQTQRLILIADQAYGYRRLDIAEKASGLISELPLVVGSEYISNYYGALKLKREGQIELAEKKLNEIVEKGPLQFQARALSTLGAIIQNNNYEESLPFRLEALRIASRYQCDPLIQIEAQRAIAIYKSLIGNQQGAISDLQKLWPMANTVSQEYPFLLPSILNSFAVILLETGYVQEASRLSQLTLASPYTIAYPEWLETRAEIQSKQKSRSRSYIAVGKATQDLREQVDNRLQRAHKHPRIKSGDVEQKRAKKVGRKRTAKISTLAKLDRPKVNAIPRRRRVMTAALANVRPEANPIVNLAAVAITQESILPIESEQIPGKLLTSPAWKTPMSKNRKRNNQVRASKHPSEMTKIQKQTYLIRLIASSNPNNSALQEVVKLLLPEDLQRRLIELVIGPNISEDSIDKILEFLISEEEE